MVHEEKKPVDRQPLPELYRLAREAEKQTILERYLAERQAKARERLIRLSDERNARALAPACGAAECVNPLVQNKQSLTTAKTHWKAR
ncbi:hypothetical protein EN829_010465 [Mesorhizobium sp. M00.F.Ca.ET.186.01.1.1]|nr:hypothetical protein EN795_10440 [bacterium M00.F.Ca.ET.152.01.1.1]TGV37135.1 hypothetical protein EN829_010465 [Mesorhizobium sp. M00.F.Ca.ET.186.01.1.1]